MSEASMEAEAVSALTYLGIDVPDNSTVTLTSGGVEVEFTV